MKFEVCSYVFSYQRRYWWMLSSILNQNTFCNRIVPNIKVSMDVCHADPFDSWNERIRHEFSTKLDLDINYHDEDTFKQRSNIRQMNLKNTDADWIIFCDGDLVFEDNFFAHLQMLCEEYCKVSAAYGMKRLTTTIGKGNMLVDSMDYGSAIINPHSILSETSCSIQGVVGAGFFQMVNVKYCKDNEIDYLSCGEDENVFDRTKIWQTRSEIGFRKQLNGVRYLPARGLWHLNHKRRSKEDQYKECEHIQEPM